MKKAVFLDLDGTLWMYEDIPASALEAVKRAQENGHLIFANTGRSRSLAEESLKDLNLDGAVYSAGSEIWLNGKRMLYKPLGKELSKEIYKTLSDQDLGISMEGSDTTFLNQKNRDWFSSFREADVAEKFNILPDVSTMSEDDFEQVMKVSAMGFDMDKMKEWLENRNLEITVFGDSLDKGSIVDGEITCRDFNKGTAIQTVKEQMAEPVVTIAIGDSENDLQALKAADIAIAMGNGTAMAKEAADFVTDDIDKDGLYKAFEKAGLFQPA